MIRSPRLRMLLLVLDGLGILGILVFTVLAAVHRHDDRYLIGQIVSVIVVLAAALVLRRAGNHRE